MTLDIYAIQNAIIEELEDASGVFTKDTDWEDATDVPTDGSGLLQSYHAVRSNSLNRTPDGGSFGGPRHDEMYTLIDVVSVAYDPDEVRKIAYGPDGVMDILTGFKPTADSGTLYPTGSGSVFVRGGDTQVRPRAFIAISSFRLQANLVIDE